MIAVAIAGILAMIAIPSFKGMVRKTRMATAKTVLSGLYVSEKAFRMEYDTYTTRLDSLGVTTNGPVTFDVGFDEVDLLPPPQAPPSFGPQCRTICSTTCPAMANNNCQASAKFALDGAALSFISATAFTAEAHAHFGESGDMTGSADPVTFVIDQNRRLFEYTPAN
jgi:type II secretory pathway pseudopilin PulG